MELKIIFLVDFKQILAICVKNMMHVTICIWGALRDLVPFIQLKNRETPMEECFLTLQLY